MIEVTPQASQAIKQYLRQRGLESALRVAVGGG